MFFYMKHLDAFSRPFLSSFAFIFQYFSNTFILHNLPYTNTKRQSENAPPQKCSLYMHTGSRMLTVIGLSATLIADKFQTNLKLYVYVISYYKSR